LRRRHQGYGDTFFIDEVFVKIDGKQHYLRRAVDQDGEIVDVFLQKRRDAKAAKRFFNRMLKKHKGEPRKIVTNKLRSYGVAHRELIPDTIHDTNQGRVRYELKTPYRDGTTHVIFEPVDFIAKLAALVPRPRVNLTRFRGVFAPNSLHRVWVTPARRGKGSPKLAADQDEKTPAQAHVAMSWAQRLKRVFNIDVKTCRVCATHSGEPRVRSSIGSECLLLAEAVSKRKIDRMRLFPS